jgi:alpha-ketoglutarate-dependent taurine dioxygenase
MMRKLGLEKWYNMNRRDAELPTWLSNPDSLPLLSSSPCEPKALQVGITPLGRGQVTCKCRQYRIFAKMGSTTIKINPQEARALLLREGWLHIPSQSESFLEEFVRILGRTLYVTDVIAKEGSKALVTSDLELDLHTDHPSARWIVWYCYRQSDEGGESLILDPMPAYLGLSEAHREALKNIYLFEHRVFPDDPESCPLVREKDNGELHFYYSFWLVREEDKHHPALIEFRRRLASLTPYRLKLAPGDILAVDNHRLFHGRTKIGGNKDRFLKRFWIAEIT